MEISDEYGEDVQPHGADATLVSENSRPEINTPMSTSSLQDACNVCTFCSEEREAEDDLLSFVSPQVEAGCNQ